MQSHEGLFDKLKLGPKYTRRSRVGTWTLMLVKAGVFVGHYKRLGRGRRRSFRLFCSKLISCCWAVYRVRYFLGTKGRVLFFLELKQGGVPVTKTKVG